MTRINLDDLIALNDEIRALSRAGVPLGRGLLQMGRDMPKQLRAAAETIGARIELGESLEQIVSDEQQGLPPIYAAVVAAGVESGRLTVALESLSITLVRVADLRRLIGLAAIYPLLLVVLATILFSQVAVPLLAAIQDIVDSEQMVFSRAAGWFCRVGLWVGPYAMWFGFGLVLVAILWWLLGRSMIASQTNWLGRTIGWLPGINRTLATGRTAAFLETLRLLVAQKVPLERALLLSAEATGDQLLIRDAQELAQDVQRGTNAAATTVRFRRLPQLVAWLLTTNQTHDSVTAALESMANAYLERTKRMGDVLRVYLPIWLTLFIGGGVTITYVLGIAIPWLATLREMESF